VSKLVTPSLFGAIDWYKNAPKGWNEKAYDDLYNQLARAPYDLKAAAARGMDFEDYIYKILESGKDIESLKCTQNFKEFLWACRGGRFQVKSKSFIKVDKVEYCVYGKIDVLFSSKIIDIKTTSKWNKFSTEKYLGSMQHIMYLYNQRLSHFEYMIAVFDGEESKTIREIKTLTYVETEFHKLYERIVTAIEEQTEFLKEHPALYDLYHKTFSQY